MSIRHKCTCTYSCDSSVHGEKIHMFVQSCTPTRVLKLVKMSRSTSCMVDYNKMQTHNKPLIVRGEESVADKKSCIENKIFTFFVLYAAAAAAVAAVVPSLCRPTAPRLAPALQV